MTPEKLLMPTIPLPDKHIITVDSLSDDIPVREVTVDQYNLARFSTMSICMFS